MKMTENQRNIQSLRNAITCAAWCRAKPELAIGDFISVKRLRSSQAFVYETEHYYFLKSYGTFVAFVDKAADTCYDILRMVYSYNATSAQHIWKFRADYGQQNGGCHQSYMYKEVWE